MRFVETDEPGPITSLRDNDIGLPASRDNCREYGNSPVFFVFHRLSQEVGGFFGCAAMQVEEEQLCVGIKYLPDYFWVHFGSQEQLAVCNVIRQWLVGREQVFPAYPVRDLGGYLHPVWVTLPVACVYGDDGIFDDPLQIARKVLEYGVRRQRKSADIKQGVIKK